MNIRRSLAMGILGMLTILWTGSSAEAQSRISASPNPCYVGPNGMCTTYIYVSGTYYARALAVTVIDHRDGREKLFGCLGNSGGNGTAPWIGQSTYTFRVYETDYCSANYWGNARLVDSVTVQGIRGGGPGPGPGPGRRMQISFNIDDTWDVFIRGNQVGYQIVQGAPGVFDQRIMGALPFYDAFVNVSVYGTNRTSAQVLEQPTRFNNYTMRIRVYEQAPGRNTVTLNLAY